jgi:hypothetical protein
MNVVWWLYYRVACFVPRRWTSTRKEGCKLDALWHIFRRCLRVANGVLCLIIMWLFLIFFAHYRRTVQDLAGRSDDDSDWTFGQVLSLATWAPVIVELAAIYLCKCIVTDLRTQGNCWLTSSVDGPEKGLSKNLSERYQVVAIRGDKEKTTINEKAARDEYDSQADDGNAVAEV